MSCNHYRWAWSQSLAASEKLVLLALVERSDDAGQCYPSIARIAADTGMNEKTAGAGILALERAGLIRISRRHGHASVYHLRIDAAADTTPEIGAPPKTGHPRNRGTRDRKSVV
jgi:hypothetical protein